MPLPLAALPPVSEPPALTSCPSPVAVVGSRGVTDYGRTVAREVALRAAADGHLIVSGGAMGADAAAHWGALDALRQRGLDAAGRTVAVFAGGCAMGIAGMLLALPVMMAIRTCVRVFVQRDEKN